MVETPRRRRVVQREVVQEGIFGACVTHRVIRELVERQDLDVFQTDVLDLLILSRGLVKNDVEDSLRRVVRRELAQRSRLASASNRLSLVNCA